MKLVAYLYIILFYICLPTLQINRNMQDIISLIKQVRNHYSASSIFVLFPSINETEYDSLKISYSIHTWMRAFHREELTTLSLTVANMRLLERYYFNVPRPMVIIFLLELAALHKVSYNSKFLKMSAFTWLVIFESILTKEINDYCYNPQGNIFHLAFDTEMLVMCRGDNALYEWYSIDGYTTETYKLANWNTNEEDPSLSTMDLLTNLSLYDRRNDLKGKVLRSVIVKNSLVFAASQSSTEGYFSTMITELQHSLNFTLDVTAVTQFGSYNVTTQRWGGAMRYVAAGIVDIGIADFSMTNNRLDYVDYLIPIITTRCCMYLKQPEVFAVKWFAYFKAFNFTIWKSVLMIFVIALLTVAFIKSHVLFRNFTDVMFDEFLLILGIMCQQGLLEFPRHSSLRIAYFTILLTAIVMLSAYSASLIGFLTARVRDLPFRTVTEFLEDSTYRILVLKGSAEYDSFFLSKDSIAKEIRKVILPIDDLPDDVETGFRRICENPKLAFYTSYSPKMEKVAAVLHIPCQVACLSSGRVNSLSMILPKGSEYTMALNFHLQKLMNSGILSRYKLGMSYEEEKNFEPVGLGSVASVLIIFAGGVLLAVLLLLAEVFYNKWKELNNFVNPKAART